MVILSQLINFMRHLIILTAFALSGYFNLNVTSDTPDAVININYSTVAVQRKVLNNSNIGLIAVNRIEFEDKTLNLD